MFKDKLKELRRQKGVTQEQLAKIIGVERSAVGQYEGKRAVIPSDPVKMKIAEFFGVTVDYLLQEEPVQLNDRMFKLRLKQLREEMGISQAALATLLGVAQSTVGMWENGKNNPSHAKLEQLSNLFGVTADYLMGRSEESGHGSASINTKLRIRELRLKKNATQQDIAEILDVSTAAVGRYERGEREMSYSQLVTVADYLDSSIDYLLGRVDVNVTNKNAPPALAEGAVRKTITLEGGLPSDAEWLREFVQSEIQKAIQGDSQ